MRKIRALTLSMLAVWAASCDSVDAAFDCQAVCERYRECFDQSYDVAACRSECRTASKNDATIRAKADACEACIGPMSCLSSVFNCTQDCGAIVP